MTRFCGNCGAQLDEDDRICGQCGTPVRENQEQVPSLKIANPEKKKKLMKMIKIVVILLIVAAIAVVGTKVVLNFTGTNGMVRKIMTAYKNYDIDSLVNMSSDMYYFSDNEDYVDQYFENAVGKNIDSFESSVGHNYKMSYKIEETYDVSQRKQSEMLKSIEIFYPNFDIDMVEKIVICTVKVTAKQGSRSTSKDVKITLSKEGKEWKLLYLE